MRIACIHNTFWKESVKCRSLQRWSLCTLIYAQNPMHWLSSVVKLCTNTQMLVHHLASLWVFACVFLIATSLFNWNILFRLLIINRYIKYTIKYLHTSTWNQETLFSVQRKENNNYLLIIALGINSHDIGFWIMKPILLPLLLFKTPSTV